MVQKHKCKPDVEYTVENRGNGWFLYLGNIRGAMPIIFCPYCGEELPRNHKESTE